MSAPADPALLRDTVGSLADWLQQLARGEDDRLVVAGHEPKSSGSENTFAHDLTDINDIRDEIAAMARDAASWLTRHALYARTVTIKVRYHDLRPSREATRRRRRAMNPISSAGRSRCSNAPMRAARPFAFSASACIICLRI
jgi:nucleotidyltransferase/DNA polymerase involved in DNA repair